MNKWNIKGFSIRRCLQNAIHNHFPYLARTYMPCYNLKPSSCRHQPVVCIDLMRSLPQKNSLKQQRCRDGVMTFLAICHLLVFSPFFLCLLVLKLTLALVSDIFTINKPCCTAVTLINHTYSFHQSRASSITTRVFWAIWLASCRTNDECTIHFLCFRTRAIEILITTTSFVNHCCVLSPLVSWCFSTIMYNQSVGRDDMGRIMSTRAQVCTPLLDGLGHTIEFLAIYIAR